MKEELATIQQIYNVAVEFIINYSFQIIGAILILIVGAKLAGWLGRKVAALSEHKGFDVTLSQFLGNVAKVVVLAFVVIISASKFGITIAPFIAALGAIAFGSSFAIAGPLSNYGAGLSIIVSRPFVVGNTITVQGVSGVVDEIRLAATLLSTEDGEVITIPNKHIVGEVLLNSFENRVVETTVGVAYKDDPEQAIAVIQKVLAHNDGVCQEPAAQVGLENFGASSLDIGLRYWVPTKQYFQIRYQVNLAIHRALAEAGITIPFPQRDIHINKD
jgi:small conductance mechanosensitive channel